MRPITRVRAIAGLGLLLTAAALGASGPASAQESSAPPTREVVGPEWKFRLPSDWTEVTNTAYADDPRLVVPLLREWTSSAPDPGKDLFRIYTMKSLRAASTEAIEEHTWEMGPYMPKPGEFITIKLTGMRVETLGKGPVFRCEMDMLANEKLFRKGVGVHIPTSKGMFVMEFYGNPARPEAVAGTLDRIASSLELSTPLVSDLARFQSSTGWATLGGALIIILASLGIQSLRVRAGRRKRAPGDAEDQGKPEDPDELARIRSGHLQIERLLRGWGKALVFLYGIHMVWVLVSFPREPGRNVVDGSVPQLIGNLSVELLIIAAGRMLWMLHPLGQVLVSALSACILPGMIIVESNALGFVAGLMLVVLPTVLAWTPKGRMVFSDWYRKEVVPATAHVTLGKRAA